MNRISPQNLPAHIQSFSYDREAIEIGIVHFGIGNFHRAHQAVYVEELLEKGHKNWGILGVSLRSPSMKDALAPQDYIYTLAILAQQTEYRVIGAVQNLIVAPQNPQAVIDHIASAQTQLVSSTITEKGYYLSSGKTDFEHPDIKAELNSLDMPATIYGFLARGLIERFLKAPTSMLTIMCCDNVSAGGELLAEGVNKLLRAHNEDAYNWACKHVSFISSMVDRVSPATSDRLKETILNVTQRHDASPVSAEPFSQWIIEDNFKGTRPAFDEVGAVFVKDIAPFERMKLSYLNAAHSLASTLGYLYGTTYVHEALQQDNILSFMLQTLHENILPYAETPPGYDGETYIKDVVERFQNAHLPYANLQVGTDSSQKIQQRWFPTIDAALRQGHASSHFAFCLAAWTVFIETALDAGVLNDPNTSNFQKADPKDIEACVWQYLEISNADDYDFYSHPDFMLSVVGYAKDIKREGLKQTLNSFLREKI